MMRNGQTGAQVFRLLACVLLVTSATCAQRTPRRPPDIWWEPSPPEVVTAMLKLAKVTEKDVVYDLGCGDGRIVIAAAKEFGARGVGIDIDPQRIEDSIRNAKAAGVSDRVRFIEGDLFEADIRDATVVTLFLWPSLNLKLRPKLLRELQPGTRVVSYIHDMADWKPEAIQYVNGRPIYLWVIPERQTQESRR